MALDTKVGPSIKRRVDCDCFYCVKYPFVHQGNHYTFDETVSDEDLRSIISALGCYESLMDFYVRRTLTALNDLHIRFTRYFVHHYVDVQDPNKRTKVIEEILLAFEKELEATKELNIHFARLSHRVGALERLQDSYRAELIEQARDLVQKRHAHIDASYCHVIPDVSYLLDIDLIRGLIDIGAKINTIDIVGKTALDIVCDFYPIVWMNVKIEKSDFVAQLISCGAQVTAQSRYWTIDYIKQSSLINSIQNAFKQQRERRRFVTALRLYRSTGGSNGLKSNIRKHSIRRAMLHCVFPSFDRSFDESLSSLKMKN